MRTISIILIIAFAVTSCRSVKKLSKDEIRLDIQTELIKKDSINDLKIDGVQVKIVKDSSVNKVDSSYDDHIVTNEVFEFEDGQIKKITKTTDEKRKGRKTDEETNLFNSYDSLHVGITEHSEIKDEYRSDSVALVGSKLNLIERKPSPISFGYLLLFTGLAIVVIVLIKSANKFNPFA